MKCRVRQNKGFRPVSVKLTLESPLELAVFRAMVAMNVTVPEIVVKDMDDTIKVWSGIGGLKNEDMEACARGMLTRIGDRLPDGGLNGGN